MVFRKGTLARPVLLSALAAASLLAVTPATASAAGRESIAERANSQVGRAENPPGSNCNPYGPCESWCAHFATWVWRASGVDIPDYAFTGDIYTWGKGKGRSHWGDSGMHTGDIVLYGSGPSSVDTSVHTGVVVDVNNGKITTVEGNSGDAVSKHGPFDPQHAAAAGRPANIYAYVSAD